MTNAHRVVSMLLATGVLLAPLAGAAAELAVGDVAPGFDAGFRRKDLQARGPVEPRR